MATFLEKLLDYYHLSKSDYQNLTRPLTIESLQDPYAFDDMQKTKEICLKAIKEKKKIMVYGDYDCDGITSTSILVKTFELLGSKIGYYIPSRYIDGYGLNNERAKLIIEKEYDLVICVDNGICALEPIKLLKDHGIQVIVMDHHEPLETLPDCDAIIHPQVSNFSDIKTSAGFCAFMFSMAMLERVDNYLLTLGAISVISDMMPLVGFNRDIVRLATMLYKDGEFYNLDLLKEGATFDYLSIALKIAPKVNAIGRIIKTIAINHVITFFIEKDNLTIYKLYNWINQVNEDRKDITKNLDLQITDEDEKSDGLLKVYDIDEGINGIVANRLIQTYKVPTIVLTEDSNDDSILIGSMRAKSPFNVVKCLNNLQSHLLTHGGHALAGGLSLKVSELEAFKRDFYNYCSEHKTEEKHDEPYVLMGMHELTMENYKVLQTFSPFGQGFQEPLFKIAEIKSSNLNFSRNHQHIIHAISYFSKIVGFNIDRDDFIHESKRDLYGKLSINNYHNQETLQFVIAYYTKSE